MPSALANTIYKIAPNLAMQQRRVLEALMYAPGYSASAGQLKQLLGFSSIVQANSSMGQVGKKVFKILGKHPGKFAVGEFEWWSVLATGEAIPGRGFVWTLRHQVVEGLKRAGFSEHGSFIQSDVQKDGKHLEGAVRQVLVNAYERNPVARERCIENYGTACYVCGTDFGIRYGDLAKGFIHVHHLRPLSDLAAEYEVNPIEDLRPVCPNCHAVIHLSNPPYPIDQVKKMLLNSSRNT